MSDFRKGDIVRLVDDSAFRPKKRPPFPAGVELKVQAVSDVTGNLVIAGHTGFWAAGRFELVRRG